mmetsp:Transcript_27270/g.76144  ORF Transcript_27270/g.76144 Transcript_27270/m.76144 type:complete len:411 (+) Transcript_27270:257-1489(+)
MQGARGGAEEGDGPPVGRPVRRGAGEEQVHLQQAVPDPLRRGRHLLAHVLDRLRGEPGRRRALRGVRQPHRGRVGGAEPPDAAARQLHAQRLHQQLQRCQPDCRPVPHVLQGAAGLGDPVRHPLPPRVLRRAAPGGRAEGRRAAAASARLGRAQHPHAAHGRFRPQHPHRAHQRGAQDPPGGELHVAARVPGPAGAGEAGPEPQPRVLGHRDALADLLRHVPHRVQGEVPSGRGRGGAHQPLRGPAGHPPGARPDAQAAVQVRGPPGCEVQGGPVLQRALRQQGGERRPPRGNLHGVLGGRGAGRGHLLPPQLRPPRLHGRGPRSSRPARGRGLRDSPHAVHTQLHPQPRTQDLPQVRAGHPLLVAPGLRPRGLGQHPRRRGGHTRGEVGPHPLAARVLLGRRRRPPRPA